MSQEPDNRDVELRRLHAEADARERDIDEMDARDVRRDTLIDRLRREAVVQAEDFATLTERLEAAEHELRDLRAVRDALTPPELPERPGLELAATFIPASAHQVSGDFYLVAEGPQESTVLVVGDVVGHGLQAGRRAAFVRTAFAATAPFSDDPSRLLSWANTALIERAGTGSEFVTAACVTYLPHKQLLRWAYAGHPPALVAQRRPRAGRAGAGNSARDPLGPRLHRGLRTIERRRGPGALHRWPDRGAARRAAVRARRRERRAQRAWTAPRRPRRSASCARAPPSSPHGILTDDICLLAARIS